MLCILFGNFGHFYMENDAKGVKFHRDSSHLSFAEATEFLLLRLQVSEMIQSHRERYFTFLVFCIVLDDCRNRFLE